MEDRNVASSSILQHEFLGLIESFIRSGNLAPQEVREDTSDAIKYSFRTTTGLGVSLCLYVDREGESFIWIESILGRAELHCEHAILKRIAELNHNFFYPLRLALSAQGYVCFQLRGFTAGFTPEQIKVRLDTLIPLSEKIREDLRRIGLNTMAGLDLH